MHSIESSPVFASVTDPDAAPDQVTALDQAAQWLDEIHREGSVPLLVFVIGDEGRCQLSGAADRVTPVIFRRRPKRGRK